MSEKSAVIVGRHTCGGIAAAIVLSERTVNDVGPAVMDMQRGGLTLGIETGPIRLDCKCFYGNRKD